jgi:hypothetical protein
MYGNEGQPSRIKATLFQLPCQNDFPSTLNQIRVTSKSSYTGE